MSEQNRRYLYLHSDFVQSERSDPLLTPAETAFAFGVDVRTVHRWEKQGRIDSVRTLGGHRRYRRSLVLALLNGERS